MSHWKLSLWIENCNNTLLKSINDIDHCTLLLFNYCHLVWGWRYCEMSSRVPVVISATHCSLGKQTGGSGGDGLFRWEDLFSSLDITLPMMHLMNKLREKGCFLTFFLLSSPNSKLQISMSTFGDNPKDGVLTSSRYLVAQRLCGRMPLSSSWSLTAMSVHRV